MAIESMKSLSLTLFFVVIVLLLIAPSKAQTCSNGKESLTSSSSNNDFDFTFTLDCVNEKVIANITNHDFTGNWFGIALNEYMVPSDAIVYTTGKNGNRTQSLYQYETTGYSIDGLTYHSAWREISTTQIDNTLQIIYEQDWINLPDAQYSSSTTMIDWNWAKGSSVDLVSKHSSRSTDVTTMSLVTTTTITPATTATMSLLTTIPTILPTNDECGGTATGNLDDFSVTITIDCTDDSVILDMTYNNYNDNWFGVIFSDIMEGESVVWTTGKNNDRIVSLYTYDITNKDMDSVQYVSDKNWNLESKNIDDSQINIVYSQQLSNTEFTEDTINIDMRFAWGNVLALHYHGESQTTATLELDLITGGYIILEDDLTMQIAHGVIMWLAFALFASIGINASAQRWVIESQPKDSWFFWFKLHKYMQYFVFILCIIGFILAIVFTEKANNPHFTNSHMITGLVVTILCVLQPLNAVIRPSPGGNGKLKPMNRFIWEIVHKGFGYSTWILGCVSAYLGFRLPMIDAYTLSYVHLFGWCGCLLILFIILSIIGYKKEKKNETIQATKLSTNDIDDSDSERN